MGCKALSLSSKYSEQLILKLVNTLEVAITILEPMLGQPSISWSNLEFIGPWKTNDEQM
jgi:hypothetical protein